MKYVFAVALALNLLLPHFAHAWGGEGHQIVCLIAEDRLTPAAKAGIRELLGKGVNISDAEIASWADELRRQRTETKPWHYADIPIDAKGFDEARDGRQGNNVVDKVTAFTLVLKDPKATHEAKVDALKFLVHLVGDMHQPLHCAERNQDRGGNARLVFFLDEPKATNLHSVWDWAILQKRKETMRVAEYAKNLNAKITPAEASDWAKGTPTDWANEAHDVAIKSVYAGVPEGGAPPKLDQKYVDAAGPVIDRQLERGGLRLATILNEVFK